MKFAGELYSILRNEQDVILLFIHASGMRPCDLCITKTGFTLEYRGNMGSTVENSVNPRLADFQLPSVELLKSLFYWREFGAPDYQWYIQFSTKPLPREKVADPVETAKHRLIVEKKRLLRRLRMSYEGVSNTLGQLTALDRNEMFLVELENFQNAIVERIDNLTLESPKAPRKK